MFAAMQAGERVDKYVLERKLGEGGMAQVWMARHVDLGKAVAIKCLSTRLNTNPEFEQRFLNEGRRQAALRHPNIVSVVDFLVQGDDRFLVMDYVEGESVSARQKRLGGRLPLELIDSVGQDIALALDYAHKRGLVHRDVKPSNILLDENGKAFLTDFGIALALGEERLTRTGMAVGTVHYMSPEQIARPKEIDHRTDIYSFGCVLYEMLTGRPPFVSGEGDTDFTVMTGHLTQPPPAPRELNPEVPDAIEQVVLKCLAKEPKDRYGSGEELAWALRRILHPEATTGQLRAPELPVTATLSYAAPAPPRSRLWLFVVGGVLLLGAGGAAFYWMSRPEPAPVVQQEAPPSQPAAKPPEVVQPPPPPPAKATPVQTQAAVQPAPQKPASSKPAPVKTAEPASPPAAPPATHEPTPAELRMRACRAIGLSEDECLKRQNEEENRRRACLALGLSEQQCAERLKKSP